MDRLLRNKSAILIFLLPGVLLFTLILFIPIVQVVYYSFTNYSPSQMEPIGFENYVKMFSEDDIFKTALKNSVFFMVFSVVSQQIVGLGIAAVLMNLKHGKNFFKNIYYLPTVLSSAALGLMWMFLFNPRFGINTILVKMGMDVKDTPQWLSDPTGPIVILPMWVIGFVAFWQYMGQTMMLYMAQMSGISKSIYEAASIDGASKWKSFTNITMPLVKPMFVTTVSLSCIGSLKFFDLIKTMTDSNPANQTSVLATHLYKNLMEYNEYGYASAIAVILLLLSLLISVLVKYCVKTETYEM